MHLTASVAHVTWYSVAAGGSLAGRLLPVVCSPWLPSDLSKLSEYPVLCKINLLLGAVQHMCILPVTQDLQAIQLLMACSPSPCTSCLARCSCSANSVVEWLVPAHSVVWFW